MKHPRMLAVAALFLAACGDNPVAPAAEKTPVVPMKAAFSSSSAATSLDFTELTQDMVARLLPSFEDPQAAQAIEASMLELNAHAIAGEIAEAQASSQAVRSALQIGVASTVLLDVMNRTLDVIDRDLAAADASGSGLLFAN